MTDHLAQSLRELSTRMRASAKNCMNSWSTGDCIEAEKAVGWADDLDALLDAAPPSDKIFVVYDRYLVPNREAEIELFLSALREAAPQSNVQPQTEYVEWIEPFGPKSEPVYCRVTIGVAVAVQRESVKSKGFVYDSDEQALEDFITVYWAKRIPYSAAAPTSATTLEDSSDVKGKCLLCGELTPFLVWTCPEHQEIVRASILREGTPLPATTRELAREFQQRIAAEPTTDSDLPKICWDSIRFPDELAKVIDQYTQKEVAIAVGLAAQPIREEYNKVKIGRASC